MVLENFGRASPWWFVQGSFSISISILISIFLAIYVAIMVPSASSTMLTPAHGCVAWFRAIDSIFISCLFLEALSFHFHGLLDDLDFFFDPGALFLFNSPLQIPC